MSSEAFLNFSDPAEARTQDPQIKSLLLYQLSYGVVINVYKGARFFGHRK